MNEALASKEVVLPWWTIWLLIAATLMLLGRSLRPMPTLSSPTALPFSSVLRDKQIDISNTELKALAALEQHYERREDLRRTFGTENGVDLLRLLRWVVTDADSGTFQLTEFRYDYRNIIDKLSAAPMAGQSTLAWRGQSPGEWWGIGV